MIRIEKRKYCGWPNAYFLSNDAVELVVLADVGPRVVRYALRGGENQFHEFENPDMPASVVAMNSGCTAATVCGPGPKLSARISRTIIPSRCPLPGATFTAPVEAAPPGPPCRNHFHRAQRAGDTR